MATRTLSTHKPKYKVATYRIDEIPSRYRSTSDLIQCFHSDDKPHIRVKSFVDSISDPEGGEHTATIEYLAEGLPRLDIDAENIELDADFQGFTPLNTPSENVAAEYVSLLYPYIYSVLSRTSVF